MIRIFVGCAANNEDLESQAVLHTSLMWTHDDRSEDIDVQWMTLSNRPDSPFYGWNTTRWATPFSGFRWAVPELCEFKGRAIYMDSDVIIRSDITELWRTPIPEGKVVSAKAKGTESWRFCVALWDCAAARKYIPPIATARLDPLFHQNMVNFFRHRPDLVHPFTHNWNCIDGEDYKDLNDPDIKILHYSSMAHQPQLKYAIPRLRAEGKEHWFDGQVNTHPRQDVQDMFDYYMPDIYEAYGKDLVAFRNPEPFGPYKKASQKNYKGHRWTT